jgi:hypothetical protein
MYPCRVHGLLIIVIYIAYSFVGGLKMSEEKKSTFAENLGGVLVLLLIWQGVGWFKDWNLTPLSIVQSYLHEPTPEEIAEREKKALEREKEREKKEKQKKQDFIIELSKNSSSQIIDFKKLAREHKTETELQNDATEKKLKGKYIRIAGMVSEVDSNNDDYGIKKYLVQIFEPTLYATAYCYAQDSYEQTKIESAKLGSQLTLSGKVTGYGDIGGLQLNNCKVY